MRGVGGVVGGAIGVGQDGLEAVHDGLHFGRCVGLCAGDVGIVERVVDRGLVLRCHTGHTQCFVLRHAGGGGRGRVALRGSFNRSQGSDGLGHHGLQTRQGVEFDGIHRCGQGGLHAAQVGAGHAGDAQGGQLRFAGVAVHHGLHGVGQCLQLRHGVHVGSVLAVDHIAQQADFFGHVHTAHTDGGVVRLRRVGGVVGRAIGVGQDGVEAVHDGLHFGRCVGLCTRDVGIVERVVDRGQVASTDAGHAHGVVLRCVGDGGRGGVVLCGRFDGGQGVDGLGHHGLQTRLGIELGGIHRSSQSGLHGAQVGRGHAADVQRFELGLVCSAIHHGLHGIGQGLHFRNAVHIGVGFAVEDLAQQASFFRRVNTIDTDGGVLRSAGVGRIARHAVSGAKNGVVCTDDGLHFDR